MISFIIVIGCYVIGLLIGSLYRILIWCLSAVLGLAWWLIKKISVTLICIFAFCIGYIWSAIQNQWQKYQAQKSV